MSAACASRGSCSGCTRKLIFARAYGTTAFTARSTGRTSMPVTVTDGPVHTRSPRPPVPKKGTPGSTSASSRNSSSLYDAPLHASRRKPGTATSPCSSCRESSARSNASSASGAAPPNCPLCFGPASVRASTMIIAMPRSATVSVGTPGRKLPMSPITIASAANSSGRDGGKALNALPTSSMPSITILIPTGGFPSQARSAPMCIRMLDLVSAAPRP
jgi:hypothetical protein